MLKKAKSCFPTWWENIDNKKYYLVLTDDLDSYLSCLFLCKKFDLKIGAFYDFHSIYENQEITKGKEPIWVDADVTKGKAFGNHVTGIKNKDCINLNTNINEDNYTWKYAGSTLMTLFSLYDVDLSVFADNQLILLMCVDSWFKQYFNFNDKWYYWNQIMEFKGFTELLEQKEIKEFYNLIIKYQLNSKMVLDEQGHLLFSIDYNGIERDFGLSIKKPNLQFETHIQSFSTWQGYKVLMLEKSDIVFSNAMTYKGKCCYSYV